MDKEDDSKALSKYLSPLGAWALSFGCSVGWGAFVMPGTTFLPIAGPIGTAIGVALGAVIMLIIGINYHYLMNRYPDSGGTLTYTIETLGYDHGFLSAWFLVLVYVAIIWANATALALIGRNLLGGLFQFGFHYQVLGYDVYFGEMVLTIAAIVIFGFVCIRGKVLSDCLQTALAFLLFCGIAISAILVMGKGGSMIAATTPAFSPTGRILPLQVFGIIVLAPWAFVGFESISHSVEEFKFSVRHSLGVMLMALIAGAFSYIALAWISASVQPADYENWSSYIEKLSNLNGIEGLPAFYAIESTMGKSGTVLLGVTLLAAVFTGLIGNYIAASRLLYSMAGKGMLPAWFGKKNEKGTPGNALLFLMFISLFIPFLGRTAIGWIVDVTTVGATIAYGYTSAAAFISAGQKGDKRTQACGVLGFIISVVFFLYFMAFSAGALSTESYLILATWSILGFVYFRFVFSRDKERRFGKSVVVWICLLFLIFFTTLMWIRQATDDMTRDVVNNISEYYEERNPENDMTAVLDTEQYLEEQMTYAKRLLTRNSAIQMALIVIGLAIMFNIYTTMSKREREMEVKKAKAEENSRAKTIFLSNMSHDIRTPMNAIIGYINLAEQNGNDLETIKSYMEKIKTSSHHLLALINDVLEMSRIESGKMDLEPIAVDLKKTLIEVEDMFSTQMEEKEIDFRVDSSQIRQPYVYCDKNRLNRILLNLLSNAYKFTPEGGSVIVTALQIGEGDGEYGEYELRVKDSGIGMTEEFAAKVFEAFERERTSVVSGIQGTGLGMAITKSIIDLMGGTIVVNTAPHQGTEFVIHLRFKLQEESEDRTDTVQEISQESGQRIAVDFTSMRLLLVEDMDINREIAAMLLKNLGFAVETAVNGQEAIDKVAGSMPGYYDGVLMDIQMPVMNGYDAARNIRSLPNEALSHIPIIAMTANAFSEDVKMAQEAGMDGHIAKPIDVNMMQTTLTDILSRKGKS